MKKYICIGGPFHTREIEQDKTNPPMSVQVNIESKTHVYRKHVVGHSDLSMTVCYVWEGIKVLKANSEQAKACRKDKEQDNAIKESASGSISKVSPSLHTEGQPPSGDSRTHEGT